MNIKKILFCFVFLVIGILSIQESVYAANGYCCVYKTGDTPIYFYDSNYVGESGTKTYRFCLGGNCLFTNLNEDTLNESRVNIFKDYVNNLSGDCSKLPNNVWYTNQNGIVTFYETYPRYLSESMPVSTATLSSTGTCPTSSTVPTSDDDNANSDFQYDCSYTGQLGGKRLDITKSNSQWTVIFPDGSKRTYSDNDTGDNIFPSSSCEDVFYSDDSKTVKMVSSTSVYRDVLIAQYCRYSSDLEQFCANGNCEIDKPLCGSNIGDANGNDYGECPRELRPIIYFVKKIAFNTLQIFVPILLIVMGSIDMVKAVVANDDKTIKDATSKFIQRALIAILCFFVVTIVTIVMDMFAKTDVGEQSDWKACWYNVD